jgi:hypothetical protein
LGVIANPKMAVIGQWLVVLGNLITLWQVRIEIIFPIEFGFLGDFAIQSQANQNSPFYGLPVYDWQSARMSHADRADVLIWLFLKLVTIGASAEHFTLGFGLDMDFHANYRD